MHFTNVLKYSELIKFKYGDRSVKENKKYKLTFTGENNRECLSWLSVVACAILKDPLTMPLAGSVIIDTDGGVDDAAAILMILGYSRLKIEAITCVRGNTDVVNVTINIQKVLDVAKKHDIPLHVGSNFGLVHMQEKGSHFGEDGFGDVDDNSKLQMVNLAKGHAAVAMSKLVSDRPGEIIVLCMGPLTNLALACHIQPLFLKLAKRVIIFGGTIVGVGGAVVPGIEFNFYMDPEAAALIFNRALATSSPVMLMPMEVVRSEPITKEWRWNVLGKVDSPAVKFLNRIQAKVDELEKKHPEHHPLLFNAKDVFLPVVLMRENYIQRLLSFYLSVDTHGKNAKGALIVDHYNVTRKPANAIVITKAHVEVVKECLLKYLA